jgi:hypothetical protein
MATRKKTTARKTAKKTTPRKAAARKAPAKTAKKAARKAVKKAPAKKAVAARKKTTTTAARKATQRTTTAKTAAKGTARKAAGKTAGKVAAKKTGTVSGRTTALKTPAVKKSTQPARKPAAKAPGIRAEKTPRSAIRKATTRPAGASGVTEQEKLQRRRAARTDAATSIEPADGVTTNFSTATAATPRARDRGTSRTRKPHRITPEEALANTRELLEAKQARDREPPPWRQLDTGHGQPARDQAMPARDAEQEAEANAHAEELHRAESRLDAIQGSVSQQDRHQQGRHDAKD